MNKKEKAQKLYAITRINETIFPIETRITKVTVPEGMGYFFGDSEYDSNQLLNKIVDRGYLPIINPRKISHDQLVRR